MRIQLLLLVLMHFGQVLMSQTIYADRTDGQVFIQFDSSKKINISHDEAGYVDVKSLPIPEHVIEDFGIEKIRRSFYYSKDAGLFNTFRIYFNQIERVDEFIEFLQRVQDVNYAEHVPLIRKDFTPNDMGANNFNNGTWHLHRINAQAAWDISQGSPNISLAIVDDAVQTTHPDLAANMLPGRDVSLGNNNPNPPNNTFSHGTHVAGISGAVTNNGTGVASIGFNIKIIPVKSTNDAEFITDGYEGITWAAANGADVINMSWGGTFGGQTGANVVNAAFNQGITLVAAAGNDNVETAFFPAGYSNVISVASSTSNDAKSGFSNYGNWITITAPGSNIRSTVPTNAYAVFNGTSMASPLVAGLCGLILSVNPAFTPTQVRNCLTSSAVNINSVNANFVNKLGAGRINAEQALICAQGSIFQFDAAVTEIINPAGGSCSSNITPQVILRNNGVNTLTSVTFDYQFSNGPASTFTWTGTLSAQQQTTVSLPTQNIGPGNNSITVTIQSTVNGNQQDANANNNSAARDFTVFNASGQVLPFTENFESNSLNTNNWSIENPDNSLTWELFTVGGITPGNRGVRLPFYTYQTTGQRDALITPPLDLSGYTSVTLDFDHAYRRFNQASTDSLIIYVSTNCGATYTRVFARGENGTGVFATVATSTVDFVPATSTDWCFDGTVGSDCYSISLNPFVGNTGVRIKFEGFNNYGNNLYLDNINVSGIAANLPPVASFNAASGTAVCAGQSVVFTNLSTNQPGSFLWSFPGGSPATSTQPNPSVIYSSPGSYQVSLTASNAFGSNTSTQANFINVSSPPNVSAVANPSSVCVGGDIVLSVTGAGEYTWFNGLSSFSGNNVTINVSEQTTYIVQGRDAAGCSNTDTITIGVIPGPALSVSQNSYTICPGTPTEISVSGANTYSWQPGTALNSSTGSNVVASPQTNISYTITGTASNGCASTETISVNMLPQPPAATFVSGVQTAFVISQPDAISGHYPFSPANPTTWGSPNLANVSVDAPMIFASTSVAGNLEGCEAFTNAALVAGKIAVVNRGGCEFGIKALNAQNAGAVACIIVNNVAGALIDMGAGVNGPQVTIPVILVSDVTGAWIGNTVQQGVAQAVIGRFDGGPLSICPGEETQLAATGGYGSYLWSSGETSAVATISAPGTVSVTAFGANGCGTTSSFFIESNSTINLNEISGEILVNLSSVNTYSTDFLAGVAYVWSINGGVILSGQGTESVTVQWNVPGVGSVSVQVDDANGCPAVENLDVTVDFSTSIASASNVEHLFIYPNPANDMVILLTPLASKNIPVQIYDASGRLIQEIALANNSEQIDISHLAPGFYSILHGNLSARFIKK